MRQTLDTDTTEEVDEQNRNVHNDNSFYFVAWISCRIWACVCAPPPFSPKCLEMAVAVAGTSTAIQDMFKRVAECLRYPDRITETFSVIVSSKSLGHSVKPCNAACPSTSLW